MQLRAVAGADSGRVRPVPADLGGLVREFGSDEFEKLAVTLVASDLWSVLEAAAALDDACPAFDRDETVRRRLRGELLLDALPTLFDTLGLAA